MAIENSIERSEYISRVASRLQVEPELILQQVRRVRPHRQKEISSSAAPRLNPLPAEIVLVQALLDAELQSEALPNLNSNLIGGLVSEQLLVKIGKIWELNGELSILTLRDQLEDAKDIDLLETISLQTPPGGVTLESLLESIRSLQKVHLDKKKRRIQADLKDKEKMDPFSDRIPELLGELEQIELRRLELEL